MKKVSILGLGLVGFLALISCESTMYAPPRVTLEMSGSGAPENADLNRLREGRTLFVHRCIECHTLPPFWHYRTGDWPQLVDKMEHRAHLKPAERDAIVAYILAARRG